jgi:hypothetical protein
MEKVIAGCSVVFGLAFLSVVGHAQSAASDGPQWVGETELLRPTDYREWVFLSSGFGMTYNDPNPDKAPSAPSFTNVFVNPSAYRAFVRTGTWPDNTMFVLEVRASDTVGSINKGGRFQSNVRAVEVEVKNTRRFGPGGWAFFLFGGGDRAKERTGPQPRDSNCNTCHAQHGAVDNTFVQFYPTLLEVARQKGTLRPGFAPHATTRP